MPDSDCLVCRELTGAYPVPGGLLVADELAAAFHRPPLADDPEPLLGHLLVVPRRHAPGWADLDDAEAAAVGVATARAARALVRVVDPERVYSAVIGHGVPHLHVHLFPRYRGTPADVGWMAVDEWDGAPRGSAADIERVAERLRSALA
jgi:histidine triad (HIT) family protein